MADPQHDALLKAYELAHQDHRAEVQLGWERQRFFVGLNPALLVTAGALTALSKPAAIAALGVGTVLSLVGALVVARSHGRARHTRDGLEAAARRIGLEGPEVTGGQRALHGKPRAERFRVVTLVIVGLVVHAMFDAGLAVYLGTRDEPLAREPR